MSDFEKLLALKNYVLVQFTPWKRLFFYIFCAFLKAWFWIKNFVTCQILNWKKYNASDFDLINLQRVRF